MGILEINNMKPILDKSLQLRQAPETTILGSKFLGKITDYLERVKEKVKEKIEPYSPFETERERLEREPVNIDSLINASFSIGAKAKLGHTLTQEEKDLYKQGQDAFQKQAFEIGMGFMPMGMLGKVKKVLPKISQTPVQKVIQVLKEAKPIRKEQEKLYEMARAKKIAVSKAVGEKVTGEKGFYAELGALKGEMPKVQFENIRSKISQNDIDDLFDQIKNSPLLNDWDKITARQALGKLFGEFGGKVPTENELNLLNRVFPKEFTTTILEKRPFIDKLKEAGYQLANIPRSIMASFDLSAPLRQGAFFITRPKQLFPAFLDMFKSFGSEKAFKELHQEIIQRPTFKLMQEGKLALTQMDNLLNLREERFMSNWAEKIPVVGIGVKASGRAYLGFLNKVRADVFDDLIKKADRLGLNPSKNTDLLREIGNFVNAGTGRGSLGGFERAAVALNSFFFSPRLMASRLTLLNPYYYVKASPFVRKEALSSLLGFAGTILTILGLAKLNGLDVGTDIRSADFLKIKKGNTRIDIAGGFQQYLRIAGQLITGQYVSSTSGKVLTLGEGYKPLTRYDILFRQIETKEAPLFSFATDLLKGQTFAGQEIDLKSEIAQRFVPMAIQDTYDLLKDDPSLLPLSVLGFLGVGLQTYSRPAAIKGMPKMKGGGMQMPSLKGLKTFK